MLALTTGELTQMRTTIRTILPGSAIVHTATEAGDGSGGVIQTFAAAGTYAARLMPEALRGDELNRGAAMREVSPWILTLPRATTIDEKDQVVYSGVTYEVIEVLDRHEWELSRRVRLMEVS